MILSWFRPKKSTATEGPAAEAVGAKFWRRQSLKAAVISACAQCDAPGRFMSEARIKEGWPGCYVKAGDERDGQSVGDVCPNCNTRRPKDRTLGEIWKKEYR